MSCGILMPKYVIYRSLDIFYISTRNWCGVGVIMLEKQFFLV